MNFVFQYEIARQRSDELLRRATTGHLTERPGRRHRTATLARRALGGLLIAAGEHLRPTRPLGDCCLGNPHDRVALRG
jgi:hypothetical protein